MDDLTLDKNYKKGDKAGKTKLIQEWLCLQGFNVVIDGDFGPATDYAVRQFQGKQGLTVDGVVGMKAFEKLILPMTTASNTISVNGKTIGQMVVAYAEQHLAQHPREIGGQNRGPWVRLYMNGNEGKDCPWCAGFACFILEQACKTLNVGLPITVSFSTGAIATSAKKKGLFLSERGAADRGRITPGSLFMVKKTSSTYKHIGLVIKGEDDTFQAIEGNTNDEGSHEGYEVCKRTRGYAGKDFVLII